MKLSGTIAIHLSAMAEYRRNIAETKELIQVRSTKDFAESLRHAFYSERRAAINSRIAPWLYN